MRELNRVNIRKFFEGKWVEMKFQQFVRLGLLSLLICTACQSPKENCQMEVEDVYQPVCLVAIAANNRRPSDDSMMAVILSCGEYFQKKNECEERLY